MTHGHTLFWVKTGRCVAPMTAKKTTTKKTDRKATAVKERPGFRKLKRGQDSESQIVTGFWKERSRPTNALEFLKEDLEHRKRKELRFVHKVLKWPSFSETGKLLRRTPLAKKRPAIQSSEGDRFDSGRAAFLHDLRSRLVQRAEELGVDMQAARAFDAAADMRANLRVWVVDPWDMEMDDVAFKAKDGTLCDPHDKHVRIGKVTTDANAVPWVELLDTKTGTTQLFQAVDEDTGKPLKPTKDGMPSFLGRQMGMHNGSCVPA